MVILLDTSTPVCKLTVIRDSERFDYTWEAGRGLAKGLLSFIRDKLKQAGGDWQSIRGLAVMKGPGSFTGLRIGLSVANTLAESLGVPIVGEVGDDWQRKSISRLESAENDRLVMPFYGAEANITLPRK